jgi:copper transport protein
MTPCIQAMPRHAIRRRLLSLVALAALLWLVLPSPAAWAHATLLGSTPSAGYAVATPPTELTLDYDQPVSISATPLTLADATGHPYPLGRPTLSLGNRRLSASVPEHLSDSGYRISWTVTAQDGDIVSGVITFAVGTGAAVPGGGTGGTTIDSPLVIVARWVLFAGLALALGGLVGHALARRVAREAPSTTPAREGPRPLVALGAALGTLATATLAADQVGLDIGRLASTPAGRVLAVELSGFLLTLVVAVATRNRPTRLAAGVPLVAVVIAEGFRAHPHADNPIWGTALTVAHLLAVAVWIGALIHVLRAAHQWHGQPGPTRLLVYDYSRLALVLVLLVIATGTLAAVIVLPSLAALVDTTYGLVLVVKLALVAAVVVIAALARRRLGRSLHSRGVPPLGRMMRAEATVLVAVLATTAVLVSVAPAGPASTDLAAPPPPVGVVVPAGTLAGQITVIATASAGQLVVRMTTPDRDDLGAEASTPGSAVTPADYGVMGVLTAGGQPPRTLALRGCGAGCFTTPVRWQQGSNLLSLTIAAAPWHGGIADLDIPWPPRPDPTVLSTVLTAMRTVGEMTLHEAVTSDYTGYPGNENTSQLPGAEFLATEPYASGGGNPVILGGGPDSTEIGLSYPEGEAIRLFVAGDGRILREEDTTPNHLITITFEYPG